MKLEQQVCSLELAQKLKELGLKQESYFSWYCVGVYQGEQEPAADWVVSHDDMSEGNVECSAFTVAELGEMLPKTIKTWLSPYRQSRSDYYLNISWSEQDQKWRYVYFNPTYNECIEMFFADTEADARAKMLVYLLENNLLTNEEK